MVPQTVLAFVAFLFLVAPGLLFEMLREKRRPPLEETVFREASRTAFTSLLFTVAAVVLLALVRAVWPDLLPDPGRWLRQKGAYLESHYRLIAAALLAEVLLALVLVFLADRAFRRKAGGQIAPGGIWFQVLRNDRPSGTLPWVSLQLTDKTQMAGFLHYYTAAEKLQNREIALENNIEGKGMTLVGESGMKVSLHQWRTVVVRGDQIAYMKVTYLPATPPRKESWWLRNAPPPSAMSPGPVATTTTPERPGTAAG